MEARRVARVNKRKSLEKKARGSSGSNLHLLTLLKHEKGKRNGEGEKRGRTGENRKKKKRKSIYVAL